jgi:O-acetyl-ADP-ribose deacetylase (regulator of RNase III)
VIHYEHGSVLDSDAQTLVNTVNTMGVMGKGLALEFKKRYPRMYDSYQALCKAGRLKTGNLHLYPVGERIILNFPTKAHWRAPSRIEYVEAGLQKLVKHFPELGITSIAFPRLGCGLGGLDWESEVAPLMDRYLGELAINVYVFDGILDNAMSEVESDRRAGSRPASASVKGDEAWNDLLMLLGQGDRESDRLNLYTWVTRDSDAVKIRSGELGNHRVSRAKFVEFWDWFAKRSKRRKNTTSEDIMDGSEEVSRDEALALIHLLELLPYVRKTYVRRTSKGQAYNRTAYRYDLAIPRPVAHLSERVV